MTIEQKPELNRFVDPSIPLTWAWRWRQFKLTLPIWGFVLACFVEMWLFKSWLSDDWHLDRLLILLSALPAMFLFIFSVAEIQIRIQHCSKRVIQFKNDKIIVKPAKNGLVRRDKAAKFQFEPIPQMQGMTILKLFLFGRANEKMLGRPFWAMVLGNSQMHELSRYLQTSRMESPSNYEIEILDSPSVTPETSPFPLLGMSLYMSGIFLLLHGIPLLAAFLDQSHHDSGENSKFSPQELAKLGGFLRIHFSSKEEFEHFFVTLGAVIIFMGIVMMFFGWRLMNREKANNSNAPIAPMRQF